jgi:hypothetical protein
MKNIKKMAKGGDVDNSIASVLKKYSPNAYETVEEDEAAQKASGDSMIKNAKEGKYKDAAIDAVKGLGTTAKMYVSSLPKAAMHAAKNRLAYGPKEDKEPVKKAKGGKISSASSRADGCAIKGKTRGKMV